MKKFLLSTLLFIGGILGSIQAEGPVFMHFVFLSTKIKTCDFDYFSLY